jgi:hypothetical protein
MTGKGFEIFDKRATEQSNKQTDLFRRRILKPPKCYSCFLKTFFVANPRERKTWILLSN